MNKLFPIQIHRRDEKFIATTALEKLADDPDRINAQLRDFADAYAHALAEARAAREDGKHDARERARGYWRIGQAIRDFENALKTAGFYLPGQTGIFARELGLNAGTLRKILAFHRNNPDEHAQDARSIWRIKKEES